MENEAQFRRTVIAVIVGMMVIALALLISITFQFEIVENLVMSWILTTGYAIMAFFLIDPVIRFNPVRFVEKPVIQEVIKFVDREVEVPIQIPMENRVIEVVEKPVIQEVIKEVPYEVEKRVVRYIERKPRHKTLNIPKFKFIGSTETERYHKRSCKFSKLIKNKYKMHSNTKATFKKQHFKACKACMKR